MAQAQLEGPLLEQLEALQLEQLVVVLEPQVLLWLAQEALLLKQLALLLEPHAQQEALQLEQLVLHEPQAPLNVLLLVLEPQVLL